MLFLSPKRLLAPGIASFGLALLLSLFSQVAAAQASRMAPPPAVLDASRSPPPAASLAPAVHSISPAALSAGSAYELLISGSNLNPRAVFSFGEGIEILGAPQAAGGGQLRLAVRVAPGALPGLRTVRVTTGNLSGQGPATLSIVAAQGRSAAAAGTGMTLPPPPPLQPPSPANQAALPPVVARQPFQLTAVKLAFGKIVPDTTQPAWGDSERDFDKNSPNVSLIWETANPGAYQWRWQIAAQPFPADPGLQPAGLLDDGDAYYDHFKLDLTAFIPAGSEPTGKKQAPYKKKSSPATPGQTVLDKGSPAAAIDSSQTLPAVPVPTKLHIRLIALKEGKATGAVSNTVIARYVPVKPLDESFKPLAEASKNQHDAEALVKKAEDSYDIRILAFDRAIFPDPNRWGCVVVVANPYKPPHPLSSYPPGEHCPPVDPKYQQKGWGEKYVQGSIEGWALGWNKLSGYYNGAKAWIANQIASQFPCELLGKKLEKECKGAVEQMVGAALSAGLAALGLPPSLPDLTALSEAGKGKIADAAVEFTCQTYESNGGSCTPAMRQQLKKYYQQGLDELQKQLETQMKHAAHEPACGDAATAAEHGLLPLPCFSDVPGMAIKPAKGSVYEPATVKVRVTRKKAAPANVKGCDSVSASLFLKNTFKGGYLGGKNLQAANVAGWAYLPASSSIPKLAPGKSVDVTVIFSKMAPVDVPGDYDPKFNFDHWKILYWGGQGSLSASLSAATVDTGKPNGLASGSCAKSDSWPVQIPLGSP